MLRKLGSAFAKHARRSCKAGRPAEERGTKTSREHIVGERAVVEVGAHVAFATFLFGF